MYIAGGWLLPGRRRIIPYSIQTLKRLKPALFRQDLIALFGLLQQQKIQPLIARCFPLTAQDAAQELLEKEDVTCKIVLVTMIVPSNLSDVASVVASAMTVLERTKAASQQT